MRVGVGLPTGIPAVEGSLVIDWSREAEQGPFSSLGVIDRLSYDSYDPLVSLAAAAGVTQRVLLCTMIVAGPLRNAVILAKEAASVDVLSGGRLVLGLAVGARQEDYDVAGVDFRHRGRRLSEQLAALRSMWEGSPVGPRPAQSGGPRLLVGGSSDEVFARTARYADGYVHGGGPPRLFSRMAEKALAAWVDHGRPGRPMLWGQGYFALGKDAADAGITYMKDYYAFTGPFAERIAAGLLTTPQAVRQFVQGYAEAGCDELVLLPAVAHLDQVKRLADVVG